MLESVKFRWRSYLDDSPKLDELISLLSSWLPPLNYITIHYTYFIIGSLLSSLIFWLSSTPSHAVSYVDSLFLAVSAFTNTGLNTRNLSEITTWQQILLWLLMIIGNPIWISFWTIIVRKRAFEARFKVLGNGGKDERRPSVATTPCNPATLTSIGMKSESPSRQFEIINGEFGSVSGSSQVSSDSKKFGQSCIQIREIFQPDDDLFDSNTDSSDNETALSEKPHTGSIVKAQTQITRRVSFAEPALPIKNRAHRPLSVPRENRAGSQRVSSWKRLLGFQPATRNGQINGLSSDERDHLGGCEYRALKMLAVLVPVYSAAWQIFGSLTLACWIATRVSEVPEQYSQDPWWAGIFNAVSAFNNVGLSLINDGGITFQSEHFVLLTMGLLILVGNTAYPILLRFTVWTTLKVLNSTTRPEKFAPWKETLEFILAYPRRVYTTLFPSRATWWLVAVLFVINAFDWVAFEVLNIGNPVVEKMPVSDQIVVGLFQAISVRACGFVAISIPSLYAGVQILYLITMYISAYPVVITMRNSNVYEERSLGIYNEDPVVREQMHGPFDHIQVSLEKHACPRRETVAVIGKQIRRVTSFQGVGAQHTSKPEEQLSPVSFVGQQIKGQLAHDLWWLVLAVFIIFIIETDHFLANPIHYSLFNILFEATSAYACVGLSMGLPTASHSLSGGFHSGSKFILCLVMLRGRHRGLPVAIDRAVRLPGDHLAKEEDEDGMIRRSLTIQRVMSQEG